MITKKLLTDSVDRLVTMPSQSQEQFGVTAKAIRNMLGMAIERYARSDEHAKRAIDRLVSELRFRPSEADIRQWCMETPIETGHITDKPKCQYCNGETWVTIWKVCTYVGNSYKIKGCKTIHNCNNEIARNVAHQLQVEVDRKIAAGEEPGPRRVVLSGAKPCVCRAISAMDAG